MKRFILIPAVIALFLVLLGFNTGCASVSFEEFKEVKASQKPCREEKEGLIISCRPILSAEESTFFFGFNLLDYRILPVVVYLENNGKDNFTFQPEKFSLASETGTTLCWMPWRTVQEDIAFSCWRSVPGFPFALLPGFLILNSVLTTNDRISANYHSKAIDEITLPPGASTQGVVFLKPERNASLDTNDIASADAWLHFLQRRKQRTVPFSMCFHLRGMP